jgi:hypothetical protein
VRLTKWTLAPKGIDTFLQALDIFSFLEKVLQVFRCIYNNAKVGVAQSTPIFAFR